MRRNRIKRVARRSGIPLRPIAVEARQRRTATARALCNCLSDADWRRCRRNCHDSFRTAEARPHIAGCWVERSGSIEFGGRDTFQVLPNGLRCPYGALGASRTRVTRPLRTLEGGSRTEYVLPARILRRRSTSCESRRAGIGMLAAGDDTNLASVLLRV